MNPRSASGQLPLPGVPAKADEDAGGLPAVAHDRWASVRLDELVGLLVARLEVSACGLARALECSADTVAKMRLGRTPRRALRARLIRLAWSELERAELDEANLEPEPENNLRWYAWSKYGTAHAFPLEPEAPGTRSACGMGGVARVMPGWPADPDRLRLACPRCLARLESGRQSKS